MSTPAPASLNILDLVPVVEDGTAGDAIASTVDLARHAEEWGYQRYWMAEHHNMRGVASSSTAVLIGHVADHTESIRVGAGGIMLPNHAPYVVAEQFGTLATMHPGRIDLGLGRAPGTDPMTSRALRRDEAAATNFAGEVEELMGYLGDADPDAKVRAFPGEGTQVPIWILGSSHGGAQVAAALGLPYSFASHFAPAALTSALEVYRSRFQPSGRPGALEAPRTMAGANVMVANTAEEAERLFTSVLSRFHGIITGRRTGLTKPEGDLASLVARWTPGERATVSEMIRVSFVGTPHQVRDRLAEFTAATGVDEVILTCGAYDHEARLRSFELLADAWLRPRRRSGRLALMSAERADDPDLRRVTLTRDSVGRYTVRNDRGGHLTTSSGTDELSPVELLLAGVAGCTAVDVDAVTTRRAEPDSFEIEVTAEKVKDEQGSRLTDVEIVFRVRFPGGEGGDAARKILPSLVRRSHEEFCTVSRTITVGAEVSARVE